MKLVNTSDGSHTIYVPELNEHYHSIHGAIQESEFVFLKNGFDICDSDPLFILEVGFGTGLNSLLTAIRSTGGKRKVRYVAVDKFPLEMEVLNSLNHKLLTGERGKELFALIHSIPWETEIRINKYFYLKKLEMDITRQKLSGMYDLVYFDAFGPDKQPELWTKEILGIISSVTRTNGILVTYSAKGEVKRNLRSCGFEVYLLPGPPGKRQMIRAIKI